MKKFLKICLAAGTAVGMYGTPIVALADSDDNDELEELTEHYWYDNENQKIYVFQEDGDWKAYDASEDAIKIETADKKTPSDEVLDSVPEIGEYTFEDSHLTIEPSDGTETQMDFDFYEIDELEDINDSEVEGLLEDYDGDYFLYDAENDQENDPANYMVQMDEIDDEDDEDLVDQSTMNDGTDDVEDTDDAGDTAGKNTMNDNNDEDDDATANVMNDDNDDDSDDAEVDDDDAGNTAGKNTMNQNNDDGSDDAGDTAGKNTMNDNNSTDDEATQTTDSGDTSGQNVMNEDNGGDSTVDGNNTAGNNVMNKVATSSLSKNTTVYLVDGDVHYHLDEDCAGSGATSTTLEKAVKDGYVYCDKEFEYDNYSFSLSEDKEDTKTEVHNDVDVNIVSVENNNNTLIINENNGTAEVGESNDEVTVSGKITWKDDQNKYGVRPSSLTIILYKNGEQAHAITVTGGSTDDTWSYKFEGLAKTDDSGNEIKYSVKEKAITYYKGQLDGYNIINTYAGQTPTSVSGTKTSTETNTGLYVGVGAAAVVAIGAIAVLGKKKKK